MATSTGSSARKVLSRTRPVLTFFSLVRTKAPPLPGLTCWNSTTFMRSPSMFSVMPFFRSLVVGTVPPSAGRRAGAGPSGLVRSSWPWEGTTARSSIRTPPAHSRGPSVAAAPPGSPGQLGQRADRGDQHAPLRSGDQLGLTGRAQQHQPRAGGAAVLLVGRHGLEHRGG